ncbi:hypothetical protein [Chitinivibrio alkaliphilus]|uniref:hypothetical protein n=1 Tax=Chitinivibrio alkaliphilus TaxID=1505232 RepID=UPI0019553CCC|nr:hypothetical protein [Chitinivibrio alkaliphilus]
MQGTLPIYDEKSFTELLGNTSNINVVENRRLKKTWRISQEKEQFFLTLPSPLYKAPVSIKKALLTWSDALIGAGLRKGALSPEKRRNLRQIEDVIWGYLQNTNTQLSYPCVAMPERRFYDATGTRYDLYAAFAELNQGYFSGTLSSYMRWGRFGSKTSSHMQICDTHGQTHHLITIAGLYNHPSVPYYALLSVCYHEMLHIACPPRKKGGRRQVHHREFQQREQQFPYYERWQEWLRTNAPKILRWSRAATP